MKAHKAINTTSVPLLTMHMFLYPHGDRSYERSYDYAMFLYPHGDRS